MPTSAWELVYDISTLSEHKAPLWGPREKYFRGVIIRGAVRSSERTEGIVLTQPLSERPHTRRPLCPSDSALGRGFTHFSGAYSTPLCPCARKTREKNKFYNFMLAYLRQNSYNIVG